MPKGKKRGDNYYLFEPAQIQDAWDRYKAECKANKTYEVSAGKLIAVPRPKILTLQEFLVTLPLSRESWGDYKTYPAYSDTVHAIEAEVLASKASGLVNGQGSTQGLKFDLSANYGWTERQAVDQKVQVTSVEVKVLPAEGGAPIASSEREVDV